MLVVTMMANPAISVPAGFSASGLPVGLQIVGRHRDEWSVLQLAHAFERATHMASAGHRCSASVDRRGCRSDSGRRQGGTTSGSALISFDASILSQSSAPRNSRAAIGTNGAS